MTTQDKQGYIIIAVVVAALAALVSLMVALNVTATNYDQETLCRTDREDPTLIVLLDKTDPWTTRDRERLARLIRRFKIELEPHERLAIYVLDETGTFSLAPVFNMCSPGTAQQANAFYQNPRMVQQRFDAQFATPLDELLHELLRPGSASRSPLIEAIHELRGSGEERLVIVSDMMQNSDALSLYAHVPDHESTYQGICSLQNPYEAIEVRYVNRDSIPVARKQQVRTFWHRCLTLAAWDNQWDPL